MATTKDAVKIQQSPESSEASGTGFKYALTEFLANPASRALIALVFIIFLGIIFNADGAFFKMGTHRDALRQASVYGILACGMTLVIISGGIDLAVGSVACLTSVLFAIFTIWWELPAWLAILLAMAIGCLTGLISGTLISKVKFQPFIATLAMYTFARGLARLITDGKKVSTYVQTASGDFILKQLPPIFRQIDTRILDDNLNIVTIIFLVCLILTWLLLTESKWGRQIYAIGGNEEAARLYGVPVAKSKTLVYVYCGFLCAIAGICIAAQTQQGNPAAATGYELTAIAMSVIGGTSMSGGKGGIGLTLLGILTIAYMEKILSINAVPEALREMVTGVIIVVAVLTQRKTR
jgi:ribose/xylose/arabinose/galactoside ABC-type transport system permease subunit